MRIKFVMIGFISFWLVGCSALTVSSKNEKTENSPVQTESKSETVETAKAETTIQKKEILWDFRVNDFAEPPNISKAETKAVLKYLFGNQANFEMELTSRVSGSFTKPNANETLYFISGCKDEDSKKFTTDCPHVAWNTDGWIAIYDGTTPVLKLNEALGYGVAKITDVNGDGISELFTTVGFANGGASETSANLGQFKNGKFIDIKGFDGNIDTCESGAEDVSESAAVISYIPTTKGKCRILLSNILKINAKKNRFGKKLQKNNLTS